MGVRIRFSEDTKEFVVPRIDDDQIDDLFYQEDEIGEMRHTAFMIECGLEEDPPDGPDVPPVPWGDALLAQQQAYGGGGSHSDSSADSKPFSKDTRTPYTPIGSPVRRAPPPRSRSTDDMDELEEELSPKTPTRRRLVAAKSGSLHAMKMSPTSRKSPPGRCNSSDNIGNTDLNLAFAKTNKASPRSAKRFMRCKSGTGHGLAAAAAAAIQNIEDREKIDSSAAMMRPPKSPTKLTRAKSGTSHGMGAAAAAARKAIAEKDSSETPPKSPVRRLVATKSGTLHGMRSAAKKAKENDENPETPTRTAAPVRKLVVAKSGTLHGMRKAAADARLSRPPRPESPRTNGSIGDSRWESPKSDKREVERVIYKNGKKTTIYKDSAPTSPFKDEEIPPRPPIRRTYSNSNSSTSSDFLSGMSSDDDNASNISISTNGSEDCNSPIKPISKLKKIKLKVKKKKDDATSSPKKKSKEKSSTTIDTLKVRNGLTSSSPTTSTSPVSRTVVKKFKAKSTGNLDIPPAFRR